MDAAHAFGSAADRLASKRVLIVDDDDDWRCLLRSTLELCTAEVCEAESVDEALHMLSSTQVDLIVSDIGMPGRDGYELMRAVRASHDIAAMPLVAWTAGHDVTSDGQRAGFDVCLDKSLHPAEVVAALAALLCVGP